MKFGKQPKRFKSHEYMVCSSHMNTSFSAYDPEYIIAEVQKHDSWSLENVEIRDMITNACYGFFDFCKAYNNGEL